MPSCIQCDRTKAWLTRKGVQFTEVDITTDPAAHRFVTEVLGYQQAPVVVVDAPDSEPGQESFIHWSGFRPDQLTIALPMIGVQR
ncbi:NrdH-redoxin [Kocuria sp. CCUG 69068]|nr:NrdH-redoxin [Kocuria sp. CCUG 69068]